ncbi:DNA-binding NarL/FixJ family response regulator [Bradyrhizobium sp. S3.3.6]|uniref:response regulator transcription factor n=1 Tax=Bradyrhizobium sp. S3.3.6 TaxID=3156429 RepID=UPI00339A33F4
MDDVVNDRSRPQEQLERVVTALGTGAVLLDSNREIAWIDERTRERLNGGIDELAASLRTLDAGAAVHCCLSAQQIVINGDAVTICLIQERELSGDEHGRDAVTALEAALADPSRFTRSIIEALKAFRKAKPAPRTSDLDILSDREREVLGLICEGRSDTEMGTMLNLSQNTIRNHIASLYRKIGVNRRSAAMIWARERGITPQDALSGRRRTSPRPSPSVE